MVVIPLWYRCPNCGQ